NGAELNNMLGFQRSYPATKLIVLEDNYRSTQAVLDTAKQIIEQAEDRLVKREPGLTKNLKAESGNQAKSLIEHVSYPTRQHQQLAVARRIKEIWKNGEGSIAVLARRHASLKQLAGILLSEGVPVRYEQQSNVLQHEAVKQIYAVAQIAVAISEGDRDEVNAKLAAMLRHPMWQLSPDALWKLAIANYSRPDWLESLLEHRDKHVSSIGHWLVWLARISREEPLALVMEHIMGLRASQYLESPFRAYYLELRPVTSQYLESLSAIELLRNLAEEFAGHEATLADFVRFVELNLSTDRVIADESWFMSGQRAVELLTVYRAKGLEFDNVFVVDAIESMWRPRAGGRASPANLQLQSYGENYDDYVRLLYVAASRAKHTLIATSYLSDDKGNDILPTPLLSALPHREINEPAEEPVEVLESDLRWPRLETDDEQALLQNRLDNYSLSPTALIDFLNVAEAGPTSFMERHLLHLPVARSAVGSYGTAIHAAMETAQRLANTSKIEPGTVIDRFEAALADEHLAPIDYERFHTRGTDLLEKLFKDEKFTLAKGGLAEQRLAEITLDTARINGKLDRINDSDGRILISDYKTGKSLNSFTTKDQTKQVKAWRHRMQLVFYALLVQKSGRFKAKPIDTQMIYLEADKSSQMFLGLTPDTEELGRLERLIEAVWSQVMKLDFPDTSQYEASIDGIRAFENDLLAGKK
ncbi:MAG TPA: ATP-dependent DNA helicase, partial [Candidatus Saccharimonadia bacterium]|nr:ATP-dependent DNA helicase [Candidatus Saccharimonadia bacterium]